MTDIHDDGLYGDLVYLRPDVKAELLTARWYTWSHLLSPVQHALNLTFRQVPMIEAYLADPEGHADALDDPAMLCAPVLRCPAAEASQMHDLLERLRTECSAAMAFAHDVMDTDQRLFAERGGGSIEHIYESLPASLRGLVELSRDHRNQAGIRIFEELLGDSPIDPSTLQEVSLVALADSERPFFLNSPRTRSKERFDIALPFRDSRWDGLIASRYRPSSFNTLCDTLAIAGKDRTSFRRYFTSRAPHQQTLPPPSGACRVRYFGHACVLVETAEVSILIDPLTTWDVADTVSHLTFGDLPERIDYVFITHNHHDHFVPEMIWQLRERIGTVVVPANNPACFGDPSFRVALTALGVSGVTVVAPMQTVPVPGGTLTSLPFLGEHAELDIYAKHALHIDLLGQSMVFLADSRCVDSTLYRRIAARTKRVDALFIGMECDGAPLTWLYGPYLSTMVTRREDESRRLSGSDAARGLSLINELNPRMVYVYAMAIEPWLAHLAGLSYEPSSVQITESDKLVASCREKGIPARRLAGCQELPIG